MQKERIGRGKDGRSVKEEGVQKREGRKREKERERERETAETNGEEPKGSP